MTSASLVSVSMVWRVDGSNTTGASIEVSGTSRFDGLGAQVELADADATRSWVGVTWIRGMDPESPCLQASMACTQRGWNRQPVGMAPTIGGCPSIECNWPVRAAIAGIDRNRPSV